MRNPDSVLILSGGLDSTTLLWKLRSEGYHPALLTFDYNQRHRKEIQHARVIANLVNCEHVVVALPPNLLRGSSQTTEEIPVPYGHYAAENMKLTVVPNRNMVMLALAGSYAISSKLQKLFYANHAGDHTIYPDCRPEFVEAMDRAFFHCDWNPPHLIAPFLYHTKAQIVLEGSKLGVPFELTWSCYEGKELHCGKCGTCVERREAFQLVNVTDPTTYSTL